MAPISTDYIYWTFSSASQSIAAFVALLLAGYTLVHALMDAARERDDSLEEVHAELRATYHKRLRALAWLTGAAVVLSLVVVYVNRPGDPPSPLALASVALIDLAAVLSGLWFVVSIVNPARYKAAAKKALEEQPGLAASTAARSSASEFFDAFRHLERLVRNYLRMHDLYIPSRGSQRMSYSFRQMIEALRQNEIVDHTFFNELLELNRYRNLVFHGHVEQVDADMVRRAQAASIRVQSLDQPIEA